MLILLIAPYHAAQTEAAIPLPSAPGDKGSPVWQTQQRLRALGFMKAEADGVFGSETALMLNTNGGQWSWDRRPILANYQGNVYAASMNGKPHGWEVIPGNDMSGHFCVHFFGARGDGSQRVDPEHLACAVEAGLYGWE